ncbi:FtsW/RodA/SpoVE family cell cycle protein [Conexibacter sp. SYSU D00693]|uniref:FtsW/RodA/SpoVE family cell cycle protein n=1 Tax=Conexibacter sp. SYSU D00693 TaxID=2812560 RepID=UPI00196A84BF|nr:FtsW/RodA/SpoVE family cell cycle protein [Conexibacter sp. SYSU D00693]
MSALGSTITDVQGDRPKPAARPAGMALPVDLVLWLSVLGVCAVSLVTLNAATADDIPGSPHYFVIRQGAFMVVGIALALVLSRIDYSRMRELRHGLYGLLIFGILAVFALGSDSRGSKRAISTPFFEIQFSELGKVLLVLVLSAFLVERARRLRDRDTTARAMLLALFPAAIVMAEDLGSGLVFIAIALSVLFVAGVSGKHLLGLVALGAAAVTLVLVAAPAMGVEVLKPYQQDRLTSFLHPSEDPGAAGYQQNQSRIAIGSGQKTGRGDAATQTELNFLPEHHTDFAFAVVGERWGFAGAALVLTLYALLIWRAMRILVIAKNLFGALVVGGVVGMLLCQVFVNVGMNVGIMPITGIPLPLLSYGGSSVLSTFLAIGLLQSVYWQGRGAAALKGRIRT